MKNNPGKFNTSIHSPAVTPRFEAWLKAKAAAKKKAARERR